MKRCVALLTLILFVLCVLGGCESEQDNFQSPSTSSAADDEIPTIRLWVDFISEGYGDSILYYVQRIPGYGTDFKVDYEYLPRSGPERESQLTSIRTEILAGKGPDVFICSCYSFDYEESKPLFLFPEQVMEQNIFLPLNDYIADAEYMEWDKLFQPVMEAGKNDEGQLVLPISYQIFAMLFDSELYSCSEEFPMTWDKMKESNDPLIQYTASYQGLDDLFGKCVDYRNDQLTFTEDEFLLRYSEIDAAMVLSRQQGMNNFYREKGGVTLMDIGAPSVPLSGDRLDDTSPNYIMIPMYNLDGGVTASITAFAAINRNTSYPELSFRMLDCLLSKSIQGTCPIYEHVRGTPVHMDLAQKGQPAKTVMGGSWYMNEWNFAQFSSLRDQVNAVKFCTELDEMLKYVGRGGSTKPLEDELHDCYVKMQMMLAES